MQSFIRLHAADDVVIARSQLMTGATVEHVNVRGLIPPGHKIAIRNIRAGEPVWRYNQIIGFASRAISAGDHVHVHNLDMGPEKGNFTRDYAFCEDVKPEPAKRHATFQGIVRADGRVATRNYIGILSSVNCSATAARAIADHFSRQTNPSASCKPSGIAEPVMCSCPWAPACRSCCMLTGASGCIKFSASIMLASLFSVQYCE